MLEAGKQVMVLSAGALLPRPDLLELAEKHGGRILVPTGALLGLDAVAAAAEGNIHSVRMTTRKPPGGLKGAPYLVDNAISVDGLIEPKRVFSGSAREAAAGFPANVNVAPRSRSPASGPTAPSSRSGPIPSVTPQLPQHRGGSRQRALHAVDRECPVRQSEDRKIVALSVLAALRKLSAPCAVGTCARSL
jgi:aspartate dehydrogenase